jgi:hypothetical protein
MLYASFKTASVLEIFVAIINNCQSWLAFAFSTIDRGWLRSV